MSELFGVEHNLRNLNEKLNVYNTLKEKISFDVINKKIQNTNRSYKYLGVLGLLGNFYLSYEVVHQAYLGIASYSTILSMLAINLNFFSILTRGFLSHNSDRYSLKSIGGVKYFNKLRKDTESKNLNSMYKDSKAEFEKELDLFLEAYSKNPLQINCKDPKIVKALYERNSLNKPIKKLGYFLENKENFITFFEDSSITKEFREAVKWLSLNMKETVYSANVYSNKYYRMEIHYNPKEYSNLISLVHEYNSDGSLTNLYKKLKAYKKGKKNVEFNKPLMESIIKFVEVLKEESSSIVEEDITYNLAIADRVKVLSENSNQEPPYTQDFEGSKMVENLFTKEKVKERIPL